MTIHHATRKRAEDHSIELVVDEAEGTVTAKNKSGEGYTTLQGRAKEAVDRAIEAQSWHDEYPAIILQQNGDVFHLVQVGQDFTIKQFDYWPKLADVLDACLDAEVDPEEGAEEEERPTGSVVTPHYKQVYAQTEGAKTHSGDWLALTLEAECGAGKGFNLDAFREILKYNGVAEVGKWASVLDPDVPSSTGRFRMNGSQKLRIEVAWQGKIFLPREGGTIEEETPPAAWIESIESKHEKLFEKRRKLAEEADELAK